MPMCCIRIPWLSTRRISFGGLSSLMILPDFLEIELYIQRLFLTIIQGKSSLNGLQRRRASMGSLWRTAFLPILFN